MKLLRQWMIANEVSGLFLLYGVLTVVGIGVLLGFQFPHAFESWLHCADKCKLPGPLLGYGKGAPLTYGELPALLIAAYQGILLPVLAAMLAYYLPPRTLVHSQKSDRAAIDQKPEGEKAPPAIARLQIRQIMLAVSLAAVALWIVHFRQTYHVGVLTMGALAWLIAAFHLHDLGAVESHVSGVVDTLTNTSRTLTDASSELVKVQKTLGAMDLALKGFSDQSWKEFYEEFYAAAGPRGDETLGVATGRVLSVERLWTMESSVWPRLEPTAEILTASFEKILQELAKTGTLYSTLNGTARHAIFVGPWPIEPSIAPPPTRSEEVRSTADALRGEAGVRWFREMFALVYTASVLRLVRIKRAERQATSRVTCSIAYVPTWVKIVDDTYWLLHGDVQLFLPNKIEPPPHETTVGTHRQRVEAHAGVIEYHDRLAHTTAEHIRARLIRCCNRLTTRPELDQPLFNYIAPLTRAFFGGDRLDTYIEQTRKTRRYSLLNESHLRLLLAFFLAVDAARRGDTVDEKELTAQALMNSCTSYTRRSLGERCS